MIDSLIAVSVFIYENFSEYYKIHRVLFIPIISKKLSSQLWGMWEELENDVHGSFSYL